MSLLAFALRLSRLFDQWLNHVATRLAVFPITFELRHRAEDPSLRLPSMSHWVQRQTQSALLELARPFHPF
jgi:hypothetical protein